MMGGKKAGMRLLTVVFLCLLTISGCSGKALSRSCGCGNCVCEPTSDRLFAYPKDRLLGVVITSEEKRVVLEGEDAEAVIDILNSFTPTGSEPAPDMLGGLGVRIHFYDYIRDLSYLTEDSVTVGDVCYTGEPGSLEPLIALYEDAPAQPEGTYRENEWD